jgi:hypothetical protein
LDQRRKEARTSDAVKAAALSTIKNKEEILDHFGERFTQKKLGREAEDAERYHEQDNNKHDRPKCRLHRCLL